MLRGGLSYLVMRVGRMFGLRLANVEITQKWLEDWSGLDWGSFPPDWYSFFQGIMHLMLMPASAVPLCLPPTPCPGSWAQQVLFFFLGPHPQHMEIPGPGVESELQLLAYTTATATWDVSHIHDLHHSSQQHWILKPLNKAGDWTCILMDPGRVP